MDDRTIEQLDRLDRDDRLRLLRFVCTFAWSDFRVQPEERDLAARLVDRLQLDERDRAEVRGWLERPPVDADPTRVPIEHRRLFRDAIRATIEADGRLAPEELDSMSIFDRLIRD